MMRLSIRAFIVAGLFAPIPTYRIFAQENSRAFSDGSPKLHQAAGAFSARGACPGTGDCCVGHGGLGCNDFECCDWVCFVDSFCCEVEWNADCAAFAAAFCGPLCQTQVGCGLGDCCSPGTGGCSDPACCDLVCNADLSCCLTGWTPQCAQLAGELCDVCQPVIVCPQAGDCCQAHPSSAGCERAACCHTVCELDPTCCTGNWGLSCARTARESCLNVCECDAFGNFDTDPRIDLMDAASMLNCFSGAGSAPVTSLCACADYDGDGDSDLDDFTVFTGTLNGP
jgi:hypothetical protein